MNFILNLIGQLSASGIVIIFLILLTFVLALVVNLIIRRRYINFENDLQGRQQLKTGIFKSELINKIVREYKNAAMGNFSEVNTQAIIEKCFNQRLRGLIIAERFVKNSVSILIILGLLGTFLGLTISVGELVKVLDQTNVADFINNPSIFITGLVSAVGGMTVAFVTSLVGIGCSILLTVLNIIFSPDETRETLMVHIEEYLDNNVAQVVYKDKETEYTMLNRILKETFVEFGEKIKNTLKDTVDDFGDRLSHVVMDVHLSSKTLDSTVDRFDASLKNFAGNIRDFTEFNFNLRNNIERMDVSLVKVTEALTETSKVIAANYSSLERFSNDIKEAADEISVYNKQVIKDMGQLVGEMKTTVASIRELGDTLGNDIDVRNQELNRYQEKINSLMNKLGDEISVLGRQTADAFSQNLNDSAKAISQQVAKNVQEVLGEIFLMLDSFKDNERILAKTIAMLPDQTITYNEAAASKINKQLDEIKGFLVKGDSK
jgi:methyl-accepting chemotaxis protein